MKRGQGLGVFIVHMEELFTAAGSLQSKVS